MVAGRYDEYLQKPDHLSKLRERLSGCQHVQITAVTDSDKKGAASADIYVNGNVVSIHSDSRQLRIQTANPPAVIERVKRIWRHDLRGPNLRDRSNREQAAS